MKTLTIKCMAIDDEPLALELIKTFSEKIPQLNLVQTFTDAVFALEYLKMASVDMLILDINMPDISGLELFNRLDKKPYVIFTTAYKKFAVEAFELNAIDYLVKPYAFDRFEKAVGKVMNDMLLKKAASRGDSEFMFVKADYQQVKIFYDQIEYIETVDDYLKIFLSDGKCILVLMTMKSMLEKLPADRFRRIHRSYIVSMARILKTSGRKIYLAHAELPVSETYAGILDEL